MKKFIFLLFVIACIQSCVYAQDDYDELYNKAELFPSRLYNDVDPYEDEDSMKYAWSPYPLFRSSANLYFKDYTIEPGYYIITPRTLKEKDYILFKQNGKVKFIIPAVKTEQTPINFFEANTPQVKKTKWQKFTSSVRTKFYNTASDSMRSQPPSSYVDVVVEVTYIVITIFYGENKYTLLFKRTPY